MTLFLSAAAGLLIGAAIGACIAYFFQNGKIARLAERNSHYESLLAEERSLREKLLDLRQVNTDADKDIALKNQQISFSFGDIHKRIESYQERLRVFEDERTQLYGKMEDALKQVLEAGQAVRTETAGLKRVLTASSGVRGKWGERVLLEILEQNNLVRGLHFNTQVSFAGQADNDLRPDFVINLPGGKHLIIDSKEVTGEYVLAQETDDVERQKEHYARLVQNIRNNFTRLSRKEYQAALDSDVPYVVMFIPSESAIRAAFATDPGIFEEACGKHVIIASPMTIVPLIYLIANAWRQHQLANNAKELGTVVEELGNRLYTFAGYLKNIRDGIERCADSWNKAVGSWEKRVSPQIERVKSLGGRLKEAEELGPVHSDLRPAAEIPQDNSEISLSRK